jgi:hypothetical protein
MVLPLLVTRYPMRVLPVGRLASVTVDCSCLPVDVVHPTDTEVPGRSCSVSNSSVIDDTTLRVPNDVIVSPATMPALAAGDLGTTPTTWAPAVAEDAADVGETSTPRKPREDVDVRDVVVLGPPGLTGTVGDADRDRAATVGEPHTM